MIVKAWQSTLEWLLYGSKGPPMIQTQDHLASSTGDEQDATIRAIASLQALKDKLNQDARIPGDHKVLFTDFCDAGIESLLEMKEYLKNRR